MTGRPSAWLRAPAPPMTPEEYAGPRPALEAASAVAVSVGVAIVAFGLVTLWGRR